MSELAQVVAYVFRRLERDAMPRNEFKQFLSFRLQWYPPAQASQLLDRALQAGLLAAEDDHVRIAFPPDAIELPLNFRGGPRALEEPLPRLPGPSAAPPPVPPRDLAMEERVRALRALARGRLSEETASLLAQRERGGDVRSEAARRLSALAAGNNAA